MERREFLGISCISAAARLAFMTESFAAASPPNIVFFLVDDMGWQDIVDRPPLPISETHVRDAGMHPDFQSENTGSLFRRLYSPRYGTRIDGIHLPPPEILRCQFGFLQSSFV